MGFTWKDAILPLAFSVGVALMAAGLFLGTRPKGNLPPMMKGAEDVREMPRQPVGQPTGKHSLTYLFETPEGVAVYKFKDEGGWHYLAVGKGSLAE